MAKLYCLEVKNGVFVQILDTQQQLMKAKAEEEQKSQSASDARRWNGLKTMVEARALLKSIFKVASSQKAQVRNHKSGCIFSVAPPVQSSTFLSICPALHVDLHLAALRHMN